MKVKPIEFTGGNDLLIWKVPSKIVSFNREIIVPFSHEVVFVKNGIIMETLDSGRHTLNPKEFSFIGKIFGKKNTEDECSCYYVNKTVNQKILWGTANPLNLFDTFLEIPITLGANGILEIKVNNARKFMGKICGSESVVTIGSVENFFAEQISIYLKDLIAETMMASKISFYEIDAHLIELSKLLQIKLKPVFDDYGVNVENTIINGVFMPQETKNRIQSLFIQKKRKKEGLQPNDTEMSFDQSLGEVKFVNELFTCKNCGTKLTADAKTCSVCGFEVEENKDRFCSYCGKKLLKTSNICKRCGKEN
ncbi:MAG: SPFH domain-containing protein [Clostridia bacterium]|nr:SPFH domain-containing protein [Clostridia bacterium]